MRKRHTTLPATRLVPGKYVYGNTCAGFAYFGEFRPFAQQSIYGMEDYGSQIVGFNIIDAVLKYCTFHIPLLSIRASNAWAGRAVFYRQGGSQYVARFTPWQSSPKSYLQPFSLKLMEATFIWHLLDAAAKRLLDIAASKQKKPGTGYNLFTKYYMKDDHRWQNYV
jgi:hypothetical protein